MNEKGEANELIRALETGGVYAECPCCQEPVRLKDAGLFYLDDFTPEAEKVYQQRLAELKERAAEMRKRLKSISSVSQIGAKATNIGLILERLAPAMRAFRFHRNDCRSLFDPIDYLIFEGLSLRRKVSKLLFVDIKTGNARLNNKQKQIKALVTARRVAWDTYKPETAS